MTEDKETEEIIRTIKELFVKSLNDKKKLSKLIDKYLVPQELEKKKNAEISTPYELRQEMLDTITKYGDADFWKTPKKVFEPCAGKGGFLIDIVDRFLDGGLDYRTIVEDCLYWADINPTNIFICRLLLDPNDEYKLNFYEGDTLKLDIAAEWPAVGGFDAVIGNPPYNNSQNNTGKRGGGDLLWNKFVKAALNKWIAPRGYLLFVHPSGWRKPESTRSKYTGLFEMMTKKNQLLYLEIHDTKDGQRVFNCGTSYDWYIIEKKSSYKKTIIQCAKDEVYNIILNDWAFLPNGKLKDVEKMLYSNVENKCHVMFSNSSYESRKPHVKSIKSEEFKYPLIHSTPKSGIRYMYSSKNDKGHFGISKVIFGESGIYNVIIDMEGKYGMTQGAMAIKVDSFEEAENLKEVLEGFKFKAVLQYCEWSNFRIDWRLFSYFKKDFWKEFI